MQTISVPLDDATLVSRCKRELPHGHAAFEQLVERHKNSVFTLCYRMVGVRSIAEDLMQEVFTKVFLNLRGFEGRSSFSSWLYRLTYNHTLNYLRRRNRERAGLAEYGDELRARRAVRPATHLSDDLQVTLGRLDEAQRSILIMKYVLGLNLTEIGDVLEIAQGAVKMRLLRARAQFRKIHGALSAPPEEAR